VTPSQPQTTSPAAVPGSGFFVQTPLSAQLDTLQYSPEPQSCPGKSRRHDLPASTPASVTVLPDDPPDDVVPLDDVVSPEDVVPLEVVVPLDDAVPLDDVAPLDEAVVSPEDPKRPESLDPPHAIATVAPTKPQQANNQARRIR
jgi:hypothetical protein